MKAKMEKAEKKMEKKDQKDQKRKGPSKEKGTAAPKKKPVKLAKPESVPEDSASAGVSLLLIPVGKILQDDDSKTRSFSEKPEQLEGLIESIQTEGVIEPLIVRPAEDGKKFLLTAGYRRLAAAKKAGLIEVPCLVRRDLESSQRSLQVAFAENIPRKALSPMELALAFDRVRGEFGWTEEKGTKSVANFFHVSTATVTQYEKLLALPPEKRKLVHEGVLGSQAAQDVADILKRFGEEKAQEVLGRAAELEAEKEEEKEKKRKKKQGTQKKGKTEQTPASKPDEAERPARPRPISQGSVRRAAKEKGAAIKKARTIQEWVELLEVLVESENPKLVEFAKAGIAWQKGDLNDEGMMATTTRAFA